MTTTSISVEVARVVNVSTPVAYYASATKGYVENWLPVGTILMWGGSQASIPNGWLLCDGSAISRTTYARLFAVLGTFHGAEDGSTTFNLPILFSSPSLLRSDISSFGDIECFTAIGTGNMFSGSDWVESDFIIKGTDKERVFLDELELKSGFLNWVDYASPGAPAMLWWRHSRYWVNVYPEKTSFYVLYFDPYGIEPSAGWPSDRFQLNLIRDKGGISLFPRDASG